VDDSVHNERERDGEREREREECARERETERRDGGGEEGRRKKIWSICLFSFL
jgi:hypothetical protein